MQSTTLIRALCNPLEIGTWILDFEIDENDTKLEEFFEDRESIFLRDSFAVSLLTAFHKWFESDSESKKTRTFLNSWNMKIFDQISNSNRFALLGHDRADVENIANKLRQEFMSKLGSFAPITLANESFSGDFGFISLKNRQFFSMLLPRGNRKGIRSLVFVSYDKEPLEELKNLLEKITTPKKISLVKKYAPEDLVFKNYPFLIAMASLGSVTENQKIHLNIRSALKEFFDNKTDGSVRFSGLAMEEIFAEIYETVIRDRAPKSAGLTETLVLLKKKVSDIYYPVAVGDYAQVLTEAIEKYSASTSNETINKKFMIHMVERTRRIEKGIDSIEKSLKTEKEHILFTNDLCNSVHPTIDYRNMVSHRYSEGIGSFEVALSLRGVIHLLIWWEYLKRSVANWDTPKESVLKKFLVPQSKSFFSERELEERFKEFLE